MYHSQTYVNIELSNYIWSYTYTYLERLYLGWFGPSLDLLTGIVTIRVCHL